MTIEPMQEPQPPSGSFWERMGSQLRNPSGYWGAVVGRLMVLANAKANSLAIAALGIKRGESVLEMGCGPGHALQKLLRLPHVTQVIGLDCSETMLRLSSRRNRSALEAGRLSLVQGDFALLPFLDETTDAVLAVNVAYFMSSPAALREARRVLRQDGRLVLYATHGSVMRRWRFASRHTHRLFNHDRLKALLKEAGFAKNDIRIETVDAGFGIPGLLAMAKKSGALVP